MKAPNSSKAPRKGQRKEKIRAVRAAKKKIQKKSKKTITAFESQAHFEIPPKSQRTLPRLPNLPQRRRKQAILRHPPKSAKSRTHIPFVPPKKHQDSQATMPKSKRARLVHLTQVAKKGREHKDKLFENVREAVGEYMHCFVFSVENSRNTHLQSVRQELSDSK